MTQNAHISVISARVSSEKFGIRVEKALFLRDEELANDHDPGFKT